MRPAALSERLRYFAERAFSNGVITLPVLYASG
jgi:hypothetical protein